MEKPTSKTIETFEEFTAMQELFGLKKGISHALGGVKDFIKHGIGDAEDPDLEYDDEDFIEEPEEIENVEDIEDTEEDCSNDNKKK